MTIWKQGIGWAGVAILSLAGPFSPAQGEAPVLVPKTDRPAATPPAERGDENPKGEPWLGLYVLKPSQALYAQLREVPEGVGFLVDEVAAGGPVEKAGLRRHDFLWKLNDQLLVNESQFLTLLALQKVGDSVQLTYFRGGEHLKVEAVLADRPPNEAGRNQADLEVLMPPTPGLPHRILNIADQTAVLRDKTGSVRIQGAGNGYEWVAIDPQGEEISRGTIAGALNEQIPPTIVEPLRSKLKALVRSFEQARARNGTPTRRVRRVPVPAR